MGFAELDHLDETGKAIADSVKPTIIAGAVSALSALVFLQLAKLFPEAMVWTALLLTPICLIVGGAAIL
eukprot:9477565-Pyramimonas_sp.AAC.1